MQQESLASLTKPYERQVPTNNFQSFFQIISSTQERAIYCAIKCFYLDLLLAGKRKNGRQLHTTRRIFLPSHDAKIRVCSYHQNSIQPLLANYIYFLKFLEKNQLLAHKHSTPQLQQVYLRGRANWLTNIQLATWLKKLDLFCLYLENKQ